MLLNGKPFIIISLDTSGFRYLLRSEIKEIFRRLNSGSYNLAKNKAIRKKNTRGKHRRKETKSLEIERIKPSGMSSFRNSRRWTSIVNCLEIPLKFPPHFFFLFFFLNCMIARFPFRELIKLSNNGMQRFRL